MTTTGVRTVEFLSPTTEIKVLEASINRALKRRFPAAGPVRLLQTTDGQIGVQLTLTMRAGTKRQVDDIYRFVMEKVGQARGRKPGEPTVQVKYRLPRQLHRWVQAAAAAAHVSASEWVALCLKERFSQERS